MGWFRLYTELPDDQKLRDQPVTHRWIWVALMCIARESPQRGRLLLAEGEAVTVRQMADKANVSVKAVEAALPVFERRRMLRREGPVWALVNWGTRQFVSDDVTERTRKARGIVPRNDSRTFPERSHPPAPGTDQRTETEDRGREQRTEPDEQTEDVEQTPSPLRPARVRVLAVNGSAGYSEDFEAFWAEYPKKREKHAAWLAWEKRRKDTPADDLIAASRNLAEHAEQNSTEDQFIPNAATFLGPQRKYADFINGPPISGRRAKANEPGSFAGIREAFSDVEPKRALS